jgi:hypothetical protein
VKRGPYYRRGPRLVIIGHWQGGPPCQCPDRRDEACRKVDALKGQCGKDGKPLTRKQRIERVAEEYGFDLGAFANYKNRAKSAKRK